MLHYLCTLGHEGNLHYAIVAHAARAAEGPAARSTATTRTAAGISNATSAAGVGAAVRMHTHACTCAAGCQRHVAKHTCSSITTIRGVMAGAVVVLQQGIRTLMVACMRETLGKVGCSQDCLCVHAHAKDTRTAGILLTSTVQLFFYSSTAQRLL